MKAVLLYCAAAVCGLLTLMAHAVEARVIDGDVIIEQRMRENLCALTFDDGPSIYTEQLLDMLDQYGIPATFFLLGKQAELRPNVVRRIVAEGHEVGNHTYSHPNLRKLRDAQKIEEIRRTDAILRKLGASPRYMRPPYGIYDQVTEEAADALGLTLVLWSLDSRDWRSLPVSYAALNTTRGFAYPQGKLRGVFLFHDTHKRTVEDLPRIIEQLRAGGCQRFVTISDYLDGILDPEPGQCMARRRAPAAEAQKAAAPQGKWRQAWPAGSTPVPLARSSRPWQPSPVIWPSHTMLQPVPGVSHPGRELPIS